MNRLRRFTGLRAWWLLTTALLCLCGPARSMTVSVRPGELAPAIAKAVDGDVLELQAGDYFGEVAVIRQKRLTLRGVGGRPVLHASGKHAEGKAILVVRDGDILIENIEFRGARVPDRNGAGIRFELGRLHVLRCAFFDNENGILTGNVAEAELLVDDSEFGQAPLDTPLPHLLYVGRIGQFMLSGSRFSGGQSGHLVKSRARINHVRYNQLVDGPGGRAAYELEFPNGGLAFVIGNVIGQSADTTNAVLVSFGAEGTDQREQGLFMVNNTLISEGMRPGVFVRVHDLKKPMVHRFINNLSVGLGAGELGLADPSLGNFTVPRQFLQDADGGAFTLPADSLLRGRGVDPMVQGAPWPGTPLQPLAEFAPPVGKRELGPPTRWTPGAHQ